jgi:hypothetical protein
MSNGIHETPPPVVVSLYETAPSHIPGDYVDFGPYQPKHPIAEVLTFAAATFLTAVGAKALYDKFKRTDEL